MGSLNMGALKNLQKDLVDKTSLDSDIIPASKLGPETDFRVAPAVPELNGLYMYSQTIYWINNKPYTSLETYGEDCPITEEIELAKAEKDPDIQELLDSEKLKKKESWLIPGWFLECSFEEDETTIKDVKVKDGRMRILSCGPQLMKAINRIATSRFVLPDFTDPKEGTNILITKEGVKLDTEYTAQAWQNRSEIPEQYLEPKKMLNVVTVVAGFRKSEAYLRSVIRNYLYGEPILKEEEKGTGAKATAKPAPAAKAEDNPAPVRRGAAASQAPVRAGKVAPPPLDTDDEDVPFEGGTKVGKGVDFAKDTKARKAAGKAKAAPEPEKTETPPVVRRGRNLAADLQNLG